ncbi:MAG TPA: carbohydrate kinase [Terracidiphilus sp.]
MAEKHLILGIGEVLWDLLPEGPRLGGAPANFAVMAAQLGDRAVLLSRVGRDELGKKAVEKLKSLPADAKFFQLDEARETGRVTVAFEAGEPRYTIHQPAAWDFLELTDSWLKLAASADALCFGSLAQRSPVSRKTIQSLVAQSSSRCLRVFDVNLRAPFYCSEVILQSLELATVLKMNDAELPQILALLGLPLEDVPKQLRMGAERLLREFPALELVAVTRGGQGSLLVTRHEIHEHPGIRIKVADTIGSGDAFTAAMTHLLLRGASLAAVSEAGNRWGAWVASHSGAMPKLPDTTCAEIED